MAESSAPIFKSFVSEKEIEDVKKKRQEEWERVRKPEDPIERPEAEYDNRTLYERLKEQKDRKQEEWTEQYKFKNMIYKGLDDDESGFLTFVAKRQADHDADVIQNEIEEVSAYREAVSRLHEEAEVPHTTRKTNESDERTNGEENTSAPTGTKPVSVSRQTVVKSGINKPKSQLSIIAGSIKTKRKRNSSEASDTPDANEKSTPEKIPKLSTSTSSVANKTDSSAKAGSSLALSGLATYSSSESDED